MESQWPSTRYLNRLSSKGSGASVGIALADEDDCEADRLIRDADAALYCAKRAGRGAWHLFGPHVAAA